VQTTGTYMTAFVVAAAMSVGAAMSYLFIVGEVKPVQWKRD